MLSTDSSFFQVVKEQEGSRNGTGLKFKSFIILYSDVKVLNVSYVADHKEMCVICTGKVFKVSKLYVVPVLF